MPLTNLPRNHFMLPCCCYHARAFSMKRIPSLQTLRGYSSRHQTHEAIALRGVRGARHRRDYTSSRLQNLLLLPNCP